MHCSWHYLLNICSGIARTSFCSCITQEGTDERPVKPPPPDYSCLFLNPTVQYEEIVFLSLLFAVQNSDVSTSDLQQAFQALKAETDLS